MKRLSNRIASSSEDKRTNYYHLLKELGLRKYKSVGIAFDKPTLDRLDALAMSKGVTRNDLVRKLIEVALSQAERQTVPDIDRLIIMQEHQTLLLDALVRREGLEEADRLARFAVDNLKRNHSGSK